MRKTLACVALILLTFSLAYGGTKKVPGGIEFTYYDPAAFSVSLAGTFNNWDTRANPMTKDEEGTWHVVIPLAPGRYEYKFVVNGSDWMADPDNPKVVGAYGNSEIEIDENGNPVVRGFIQAISNTPANARVMITGWFRGTYTTRKDALGDVRWRLSRPAHEMYISFNPTIGDDVKGSGTIRIDSGEGDIREITADLYAGWLKYKSSYFDVTAYHNEEILSFDDPLGALGHEDLDGTPWKDDIDFGRGTQGLITELRIAGATLRALYANTYDSDIYNSPTRWLYDPADSSYSQSNRYDNVGTDVLAVRAKRKLAGVDVGMTFVSRRNGWWVGFESQRRPPELEKYERSFWFEMGTSEIFAGADLGYDLSQGIRIAAEYALTRYDAGWDAGNRERKQGDTYVDGKIDEPVGDEDGRQAEVMLEAKRGPIRLNLSFGYSSADGMDPDEVYVTHHQLPIEDPDSPLLSLYGFPLHSKQDYVDAYTNVFNIEQFSIYKLEPLPERRTTVLRAVLGTKVRGVDASIGFDLSNRKWDYRDSVSPPLGDFEVTYLKVFPSLSGKIFGERLSYRLDYAFDRDDMAPRMPSLFDRHEVVLKGTLDIVNKWGLYYNLRRVTYKWTEDGTEMDASFFNPHLALVWNPVPRVEVRLGYGLNPLYYRDTPVEGREIGRERWISSALWDNPTAKLVDVEQQLKDLKMISLMGVIAF